MGRLGNPYCSTYEVILQPWAPTASHYLVLFDVSDAKVRRQLDRKLAEFGFLSPQFSVRMAVLTPGEVRRLKAFFLRIGSTETYLILLPLGTHPPQAIWWGHPLGTSQLPWCQHPGHPPALHVAYPGEQPL